MKYLAIDSETCLSTDEQYIPDLVCVSYFDGQNSGLLHWTEVKEWLTKAIKDATKECPLVFHYGPFDLAVFGTQFPDLLPEIFAALDRDAICDTMVREKLIKIAEGSRTQYGFSLKDLVKRYFEQDLEKDQWRLSYGELRDLSLDSWPQGAKDYAIKDAIVTGKVYEAQQNNSFGEAVFYDEANQNRANFALHLASSYGVITDIKAVEDLETRTLFEYNWLHFGLYLLGLVDEKGKRDSKATEKLMIEVLGEKNVPRTPTGRVKTDEEACESSHNEGLKALARYRQLQTLLSKDIEVLKKGTIAPIHTRYDVLLNTGRTSSSKPNLQNPRREPGVRECFIPRPGYVYCSVDYDSAELHTLSQICYSLFGQSRMREKLNEGADLHLDFASQLLNITYSDALKIKKDTIIKENRQRAKVANFGFPGGMGHNKLATYAKSYGVEMTVAEAKILRSQWHKNWPEMKKYFSFMNNIFSGADVANIKHFRSNRLRGGAYYTEACNSFFQGLAADGAKAALYELTKASYIDINSPIYGARPILFVHDEIICELPENKAHEAASEMSRIMINTFNQWTPDVPAKAEACLMKRWSKKAEAVYDESGRLIPWELQ